VGRLIDIAWPAVDVQVTAKLADDMNPELCDDFWAATPFRVLQSHPVVSGESVYAWAPLVSTAPVRRVMKISDCPVGSMRYSQATGNKFSVQYGRGLETTSQPVLGAVLPEFAHRLPTVGRAAWENTFWTKEFLWVEVRKHGDKQEPRTPTPDAKHPTAKEFIDEAARICTTEPDDLRRLRLGLVESAGSFGQYFTTWDFANGMIRDYVMYTIYPLLKFCKKLATPALVADALDTWDTPYSEFLAYCGFTTLDRLSADLKKAVRSAKTLDEVEELIRTFLLYGNRLCAWSYHFFPHHMGVFYKREDYRAGLPGRWRQVADAGTSGEGR